ncbi:esterase family protein [Paenibacillus sp. OV219]|uniref:alpha/beta hydrolase n=1 Tax=Paenibacillus sp. OV219 TaxID=1884377 RepID=UPI0008D45F26|nr:alpha/beta hydrolase-fold protein [Paenibacillus sp. OV219]SEM84798.1 Enterochelin esterase [Paenibacillus sp. OV219]
MTDARYLKRTIVKDVISSQNLPEVQRNLRIYLPPGYNELLSYPVVYCQDGEQFFNFGRIATTANQLILDEGIEPFIIVGVEVDLAHRTAEYAPNGDRHKGYVAFFGDELILYIESKYPARREKSARILAGDSLGGTVSLHIALSYPDLFDQVISLSGAFYPASRAIVEIAPDLSQLSLFMIVGLQETAFKSDSDTVYDFVAINREMRAILERKGARIAYSEHNGDHVWGFWQQHIPDALRTFLHAEA